MSVKLSRFNVVRNAHFPLVKRQRSILSLFIPRFTFLYSRMLFELVSPFRMLMSLGTRRLLIQDDRQSWSRYGKDLWSAIHKKKEKEKEKET